MGREFTSRCRRMLGGVVLAGLSAAATQAWAGPNSGKVNFTLGTDITTAYFFRGILQERDGFIMQPYAEVNVPFYQATEDDPGPFTYVGGVGGIWLSVQTERTLATHSPENLYETDYYGGLKFGLFNKVDLRTIYYAYTSPNGGFNTTQELDFSAALNDSDWLGKFALNPSATVAYEVSGTSFGDKQGTYIGLGLRPGYTIDAIENYPVSLALPLTWGLSPGNYFELPNDGRGDTFGYFQGGLTAAIPLAFIPEDYGAWSVAASVYVYTFGHNLQIANKGNDPWVVGTWGFSMTY